MRLLRWTEQWHQWKGRAACFFGLTCPLKVRWGYFSVPRLLGHLACVASYFTPMSWIFSSPVVLVKLPSICERLVSKCSLGNPYGNTSRQGDPKSTNVIGFISPTLLGPLSHTRLRAHDHCTSSTLNGGKGGAGPSSLHTMLRDRRSKWMQDGCKVYTDSNMASNGSCFMVTWTIPQNHFLEVGLTQNWETIPFQNLTTIEVLYFIMSGDHAWIEVSWNSIWLRTRSQLTSHYTWGPVSHYMILEVSWDGLWTLILDPHNFMVTALGLCVKWPLVSCSNGLPPYL